MKPLPVTVGVDVGGTKCAAGLVDCARGERLAGEVFPTSPERGGAAVLADALRAARALVDEGRRRGTPPVALGIGVAELVDRDGRLASGFTIDWRGVDLAAAAYEATGLPLTVDADVRAAARAEGAWGAGRGIGDFVYLTVGTGVAAALVIDGEPYRGARGLTGTVASAPTLSPDPAGRLVPGQPLEGFAAGPAIARRYRAHRPEFAGDAREVVARATAGDPAAREVLRSAGEALGAQVAALVNTLDPAAVVVGGGLGLVEGEFRAALDYAFRRHVWSDLHREAPLVSGALGPEAGMLGAALGAARAAATREGGTR